MQENDPLRSPDQNEALCPPGKLPYIRRQQRWPWHCRPCCGTTVLSAEETKELLTLSQKTMATVESMAAEMTMEMDMSMGEETAETTTVAKILTQQNPLRMQMNLSATLEDGTEAQNMQMYAEEEDGKLRTYVLAADTWYSQTMELGGLAQYNAEENVTLYLSNLADFSATATEKINDTEATKIEGMKRKQGLTMPLTANTTS